MFILKWYFHQLTVAHTLHLSISMTFWKFLKFLLLSILFANNKRSSVQRGKRRREEGKDSQTQFQKDRNLWEVLMLEKFMEDQLPIIFQGRFSQETTI